MSIIIDNIRLPDDIERGSRGGPSFNTTILPGSNFDETAIQNWATERRTWDISYGVLDKVGYVEILDFFRGRRGSARGFLFKDWTGYQMPRQTIGTGNGSNQTFDLNFTHPDTVLPYIRKITHPTLTPTNTMTVWVNGIITAAFTFLNGVITFTVAPPNGQLVEAKVDEYLIPVRFDVDEIKVELFWENAGPIPEMPVVELTSQ